MHQIAVIIPKYGVVGGAEQFVAELTNRLSVQRHDDFHVFANCCEAADLSIKFHRIPIISFPKFLTTVSFALFVRQRLAAGSYDLVHSHDRIFAADLFTLHGIPHRYWIHHIRRKKMSLYDMATAWVEKKLVYEGGCKKFIAVSNLTRDIFLREYPMDPQKVAVIHPGVHLSDYAGYDREVIRVQIRKEYGIPIDEMVLVFASMNFEIKGLDAIVNALAKLKSQGCHFSLLVAGKGDVRKYSRMAQKAGIAKNIIFTGQLEKENLIRHYLAGDMYIMLSEFDTFGMVVLEAMAAGLPVIISANVGAKDLIRQGVNGFVIENPSDGDDIAAKIKLIMDKNTRADMSRAAMTTAAQNTWDSAAAKYSQLYTDVLAARRN